MQLPLTCQHTDANSDAECGLPAAILIVTSESCYDPEESFAIERTHAFPVCSDHAPEEVRDSQASMGSYEFAVVKVR